jgi:hypothetical protein
MKTNPSGNMCAGLCNDEAIVEMKDAVETMVSFANDRQAGVNLPLWVPTRKNREYTAVRNRVISYITTLIAQRRTLPEDQWPDDLLTRLMQATKKLNCPVSFSLSSAYCGVVSLAMTQFIKRRISCPSESGRQQNSPT